MNQQFEKYEVVTQHAQDDTNKKQKHYIVFKTPHKI